MGGRGGVQKYGGASAPKALPDTRNERFPIGPVLPRINFHFFHTLKKQPGKGARDADGGCHAALGRCRTGHDEHRAGLGRSSPWMSIVHAFPLRHDAQQGELRPKPSPKLGLWRRGCQSSAHSRFGVMHNKGSYVSNPARR